LCDPVRRDLFFFLVDRDGWVSRDEAADALGLRRGLVAHHLDRLATDGLLDVEYRRLTGRSGPGAGRPAKLYRRVRAHLQLTIPARNTVAIGWLLVGAIADAGDKGDPVRDGANIRARQAGEDIGRQQGKARSDAGRRRALVGALVAYGYAPYEVDGELALGNCPYEPLASEDRELVCGINASLIEGAVAGVGLRQTECALRAPMASECCVRVTPWPPGQRNGVTSTSGV
jgi:predicted ArsR family transcriptional regulator